MLTMFTVA